ncbi:MAG: rubredoxin [Clostridiales bacterium]|nr:rubredoxin [Clostridiales bacterium]
MKRYVCTVCGYVYDEAKGVPGAGIPAGTAWESLPANWVCPLCGAARAAFRPEDAPAAAAKATPATLSSALPDGLRALEASALCSNLARGCEKQYLAQDAARFGELAAYFGAAAEPAADASAGALLTLTREALETGIPKAVEAAKAAGDRGALRALVWHEKVARIQQSLLTRYAAEGEAMTEGTNVFVCPVCGFIALGETPPELCPVCKVPGWKFEKVEGR